MFLTQFRTSPKTLPTCCWRWMLQPGWSRPLVCCGRWESRRCRCCGGWNARQGLWVGRPGRWDKYDNRKKAFMKWRQCCIHIKFIYLVLVSSVASLQGDWLGKIWIVIEEKEFGCVCICHPSGHGVQEVVNMLLTHPAAATSSTCIHPPFHTASQ